MGKDSRRSADRPLSSGFCVVPPSRNRQIYERLASRAHEFVEAFSECAALQNWSDKCIRGGHDAQHSRTDESRGPGKIKMRWIHRKAELPVVPVPAHGCEVADQWLLSLRRVQPQVPGPVAQRQAIRPIAGANVALGHSQCLCVLVAVLMVGDI